jgi:hypothetical protein
MIKGGRIILTALLCGEIVNFDAIDQILSITEIPIFCE